MKQDYTLAVSDTNEQALASKISAIRKGYFADPYAEEFATFRGNRDILMHRGYWARVHVVRRLVQSLLDSSGQQPVQIVSLGCGLQTLWFNLMDHQKYRTKPLKFLELDLEGVVKRKVKKIQKSKLISSLLGNIGLKEQKSVSESGAHLSVGQKYFLSGCDLSNIAEFKAVLAENKFDPQVPTLFYCECVLSYIKPEPVDELLKYIKDTYRLCWIFDYEMFNPNDRFGKMMVQNFDARGCPLAGIHAYPNLEDQATRFLKAGFERESIELDSMDKIYYRYIDKNERAKIEKIEMLDELEEWNIIMGHYFGLVAHNCLQPRESDQLMIKAVRMKQQQ